MEIGKYLSKGATAEVYELGRDKVLKLYYEKHSSKEWLDHEFKISQIIHDSGIASPAVYETVEIDGRSGIIYEKIAGKTVFECLKKEPWKLNYYIQKIADLQQYIHKFRADGLPSQMERFTFAIRRSAHLLGNKTKKILDYIESLPNGESVCHGDLYINNIIVSNKKLVPIDWNGAYTGNPASDVARTCMIIRSPGGPFEVPEALAKLSGYPKHLAVKMYLNEYFKFSKISYSDIDAWILPVAAAKLKDKVPGDRKWLLKIINERLEKLN